MANWLGGYISQGQSQRYVNKSLIYNSFSDHKHGSLFAHILISLTEFGAL